MPRCASVPETTRTVLGRRLAPVSLLAAALLATTALAQTAPAAGTTPPATTAAPAPMATPAPSAGSAVAPPAGATTPGSTTTTNGTSGSTAVAPGAPATGTRRGTTGTTDGTTTVVVPGVEPATGPPPALPGAPPPPPPPTRTTITTVPNEALPATALPVADNALQLSLEDAVSTAMQRNLGLLVQRFDREQFHLSIAQSLGIYDLGLTGQAYATSSTQPATSRLVGTGVETTKQRNENLGANQLTPWGGVVGGSFNLFRQESNSRDVALNPLYAANLDFTLTQPLLRNFGKTATERGIRIAQINSKISRETFEQLVTTTLEQVEDGYWNLVEARRQYGVAQEALALARELHHQNQVRVQVGTLAPLELVQSEAGIATRQEDIVTAQAAVQNAEDALRQLLHLEEGDLWDLPINPTTPPETVALAPDLRQSLGEAMESRPELRNQHLQLDLRQLDVAYYHNQMLPRLDLSATYGYAGVGGDVINPTTGQVIAPGNGSDAVRQVRDRDFNSWRLQLDFAYPLQNRSARTRYAIANVSVEQGRTQLAQLEESIRTEVRTAVRGVTTAAQQIQSSGAARGLAEKNLDAERKRYENGLSTSFQVLIIQQDLTAARSAEVAAIAGYRRALAAYYRSTGRLIAQEGVALDDPMAAEPIHRYGFDIDGDLPATHATTAGGPHDAPAAAPSQP